MMLLSATFTFLISNAVVTLASSKRGLGYAPGSTLPADLALFSSKQSVVSWLYNCTSLPLLLPSFAVHPHTHTCFLSPYIDASRFPALYVYVSSQGGRTPPATTGFGYLDFTVMQWSDVNIDSLAATLLQQGRFSPSTVRAKVSRVILGPTFASVPWLIFASYSFSSTSTCAHT
jgi:hypothetical protein